MGFFLVLKAEVVRAITVMRRYWFATVTSLIIGYGFMIFMILGLLYNREGAAATLANQGTKGALGFIIGIFAFGIVGIFTQGLQSMASTGELEQLCMSPHGILSNFLARSLVSAVFSICTLSILLTMIATTLGGALHADPIPLLVLLALTYVNLIGFGFMLGGLVLVFKQVGQIATMFRMALILLATVATTTNMMESGGPFGWLVHIVPIADASLCLKNVLIDGQGFAVFFQPHLFWLLANAVFWTTVGAACFRYMENYSRDKGTLGIY